MPSFDLVTRRSRSNAQAALLVIKKHRADALEAALYSHSDDAPGFARTHQPCGLDSPPAPHHRKF